METCDLKVSGISDYIETWCRYYKYIHVQYMWKRTGRCEQFGKLHTTEPFFFCQYASRMEIGLSDIFKQYKQINNLTLQVWYKISQDWIFRLRCFYLCWDNLALNFSDWRQLFQIQYQREEMDLISPLTLKI